MICRTALIVRLPLLALLIGLASIGCKKSPEPTDLGSFNNQTASQEPLPLAGLAASVSDGRHTSASSSQLLDAVFNCSLDQDPDQIVKSMRMVSHKLATIVEHGDVAISAIEDFWMSGRDRIFTPIRWHAFRPGSDRAEDFLQSGIIGIERLRLLQRIQGRLVFPLSFRIALIECLRDIKSRAALTTLQRIGQGPKNATELLSLMEAIKSIDQQSFALYWPVMAERYSHWFNEGTDLVLSFELQRLTGSLTAPDSVDRAARALVKQGRIDLAVFAYLEMQLGAAAVPCYMKAFREGEFTLFVDRAYLAGVIENHVATSGEAKEFVVATIVDSKEDDYTRNALITGLGEVNPLSGRRTEFTRAEAQDRITLLERIESELAPSDDTQKRLIQAMRRNFSSGLY